jgi:hypothetical protein
MKAEILSGTMFLELKKMQNNLEPVLVRKSMLRWRD